LNALDHSIVERSVADLEYHARFLDAIGVDSHHKITLHTGGHYGDTQSSLARFRNNFMLLSKSVQRRLVIENDEKFNIDQVLELANSIDIPAVFDIFHHECHPTPGEETLSQWLNKCWSTWRTEDGIQKIHYSQQDPEKKAGSHSAGIEVDRFLDFVQSLGRTDIDIMLEVKDKNLSAVRCIDYLKTRSPA
jgi:UV DNA damage endonuclease